MSVAQTDSRDPFQLHRLDVERVRGFVALSTKLQQDFRLAELFEARKTAMAAKDAMAAEAAECGRRRNDGLVGASTAELDGCVPTLRQYSQRKRNEAATTKRISQRQRLTSISFNSSVPRIRDAASHRHWATPERMSVKAGQPVIT